MSANPVANGGVIRKPLKMPNFQDYAIEVKRGGTSLAPSMANFAKFLRDITAKNMTSFRLFGPDETESNKLGAVLRSRQEGLEC